MYKMIWLVNEIDKSSIETQISGFFLAKLLIFDVTC